MDEDWEATLSGKPIYKSPNWIDFLVDSASSLDSSLISEIQTPNFEIFTEKPSQDFSTPQLREQISSLSQICEILKQSNSLLQQESAQKSEKISELEQKNKILIVLLEKNEDEKSNMISLNKSLAKSLQGAIDEYMILTNELKKKWTLPEVESTKLLKYSKFLIKNIKTNPKLKTLFDDRVNSYKFFLQNVSNHNLDSPFLNLLQFVCDFLLNKSENANVGIQTSSADLGGSRKASPVKHEAFRDFFTEPDVIFEESQDGDMVRNVSLQSERLAKLHKQISETMKTNKMILTNPLKSDHSRSRSENISKYFVKG